MADREGSGANEQQEPERHHAVDAASLLRAFEYHGYLAASKIDNNFAGSSMEPRLSPSQRRVLSASRRLPSLEPPSSAQLAGCTRRPLSASPRAAQLSSGRARTPSADDGRAAAAAAAAAAAGAAQRVHAASLAASEVRSLDQQPLPPFVAAATNAPLLELLRWLQRYVVVADALSLIHI